MSLSKQLLLLVSLIFLVVFSINFVLSLNKIKSYLEIEAQVHAQDTATSLGLSLSPYMTNESDPILETMINAIFDMGYYREIKLVNVDNKTLIKVTNDKVFSEVPQWLVDWLPMQTATASSEISSGWMLSGTIFVSTNPGFGYLKLYQLAQSAMTFTLITFVGAVLLLFLILRFVLSPLKNINALALSIAEGQFKTIEKIPWTTEVKNVALSMNLMSKKIEGVIDNLNNKLDSLGKKLHNDDLTGLLKKKCFESDMKQLFLSNTEAYVFIIKIDSLTKLTKEYNDEQIDTFLKAFAQALRDISACYQKHQVTPYRLLGSEFALLGRTLDRNQAERLAQSLIGSLTEIAEQYGHTDIAHIGISSINPLGTPAISLASANEAFEQAQLIGANSYFIKEDSSHAKDVGEWKNLVLDVIDNRDYEIAYLDPIQDLTSERVLIEEASFHVLDSEGNPVPIGPFVAIAEKFTKIIELDRDVIQHAIECIDTQHLQHAIAVNVSTRTIKNAEFRTWLAEQLKSRPVGKQLIFNIAAYAVTKDFDVYCEFFRFVRALGAGVMIKRFEPQSMPLEYIKALRPDFIRLTRELSNDLTDHEAKTAFIETIVQAAKLLDIRVIAENVQSDEDRATLLALGVDGASR